jgi:hypothetical protein
MMKLAHTAIKRSVKGREHDGVCFAGYSAAVNQRGNLQSPLPSAPVISRMLRL